MLESNLVPRRMGVLLAFVAALVSAACGGSSPSAPDVAQARGAIIRGSVQDSSTSGSDGGGLSASSTSRTLKVSVVGTNLSTSTNGSGEFVLTGVPTGRVELRFEGPGLDARLEIGGLSDGQEIRITVRVNGNGVVLVSGGGSSGPSPSPSPDDDDDDVEFTGRLDAINGATLTVAGRTVVTNAATRIRRRGDTVPFSALQVGQIVEVEGSPLTGGSVLARKVTIEDDGEEGDDDEEDEDEDEDEDDDDDDEEDDDDEDEDDEDDE